MSTPKKVRVLPQKAPLNSDETCNGCTHHIRRSPETTSTKGLALWPLSCQLHGVSTKPHYTCPNFEAP